MDTKRIETELAGPSETNPEDARVPAGSAWSRMSERFAQVFGGSAANRDTARKTSSVRYRTLIDDCPWTEYLPDRRQILFSDGMTVMAGFDIQPIPLVGTSDEMIARQLHRVARAVLEIVPQGKQNPWVVSLYGYLDEHHAEGDDTARADGGVQRAHLVLYRRYESPTSPKSGVDSCDELDELCTRLGDALGRERIVCTRMSGESFYRWLARWFNPDRTGEIPAYPGDDDLPIGSALGESLCLSPPLLDVDSSVWYFGDTPCIVLSMESLTAIPVPGAIMNVLGTHVQTSGARVTIPTEAMVAMTVVFDSDARRELVKRGVEQPVLPMSLGIYLRAPTLERLKVTARSASAAFRAAGVATSDPFVQEPAIRASNVIRFLPGVIKPSIERRARRRARLVNIEDILRIAPIYQRACAPVESEP